MIGICEGCEQEGTVTEYVYIDGKGKSETQGIFCPDCMCCSYCGEVLEPHRLAFMDTVQIKGMGIRMSVPARWCAACVRDCPDDPILESEPTNSMYPDDRSKGSANRLSAFERTKRKMLNEIAEEWDVQP